MFERKAPLDTWRSNAKRLLHPNWYSWPERVWGVERAGVPLLDWSAGDCSNVADDLLLRWERLRSALEIAELPRNVVDLTIESGRWRVHHAELDGSDERSEPGFAACVFAGGWGAERHVRHGTLKYPYWHDDPFDNHDFAPPTLVVGCGDGGLVDYLRLSLYDFKQQSPRLRQILVEDVGGALPLSAQVANTLRLVDPVDRLQAWLDIQAPELDDWIIERMNLKKSNVILADRAFRVVDGREVAVVPLEAPAFPLNRLLAARVLRRRGLVDATRVPPHVYRPVTVDRRGRMQPPRGRGEQVLYRLGAGSPFPRRLEERLQVLTGRRANELPGFDPALPDPSSTVLWTSPWSWDEGSVQAELLEAVSTAETGFELGGRLLALANRNGTRFVGDATEDGMLTRLQAEARPVLGELGARFLRERAQKARVMETLWRQLRAGPGAIIVAFAWARALDGQSGDRFVAEWRARSGSSQLLQAGDPIPLPRQPVSTGGIRLDCLRLAPDSFGTRLRVRLDWAPKGKSASPTTGLDVVIRVWAGEVEANVVSTRLDLVGVVVDAALGELGIQEV